jgi:glyoxylase-like metal-dependent hydrolase (beta-lactamase superfamily II)
MLRTIASVFVRHLVSLLAVLAFVVPVAYAQQGPQSLAELLRLHDDTFIFRSAGYTSLFITTDDGVIVVDPIGGPNAANPAALKAAIETITSAPVRYMIYSHAAADHGTGGAVFADTAEFLAHRNAAPALAQRNDATTPVPTILVDDSMALELGGKTVELRWAARSPQDDYLTVHYRDVLMVVDNVRIKTLPFQDFGNLTPEQHIAFVERLESDPAWQWYAYGHSTGTFAVGTREDMREYRQYIIDIIAAVRAARAAGLADDSQEMVDAVVAELQPRYGSWGNFPNGVTANVRGVVRSLR